MIRAPFFLSFRAQERVTGPHNADAASERDRRGERLDLLRVGEAALADAADSIEEADGGEEHEQGADPGGQGYGAG